MCLHAKSHFNVMIYNLKSLRFGFCRRVLEGSIGAINPLASRAPATRRPRPGKPLVYNLQVKANSWLEEMFCAELTPSDV